MHMTDFKTIARPRLAIALAASALMLLPATAAAQTLDPGAPSPGTPQGNQYEIPVQAGRHDAAPPRAEHKSGGGGSSLYRSENNFGSSSVVPGDPGSGGGGQGSAGGASGAGGGTTGTGRAASVAAAGVAASRNPLDTGQPSTSAAYITLPLIIGLGIVVGIAGVAMRRRQDL
jgi:hypothetical protein